MFFGSTVFKKVNHLSGGERVRLQLSKLLYEDINLLILDEPTNHLDIESIETLENALEEFKGTILFISHDRYFINKMSDKIIEIRDNSFKNYSGNYDFYKNEKNNLQQKLVEKEKANKEKLEKGKGKGTRKIDENKKKERDIAKLEVEIASLEEEIKKIDEKMNSLESDYTEINELFIKKEELKNQLDQVIQIWVDYNN